MVRIYETLRGEIAKQCKIRKLKYRDIAAMTGYKEKTINMFMCGKRNSTNVAIAISEKLQINTSSEAV